MKTLDERFWEKVDKGNDCWNWIGAKSNGYGQIKVDGKALYAHRVSYEPAFGSIETGLDLDHLCRNRQCVNPSHLEPVTRATNLRRGDGTKLTERLVREIRTLYESGDFSQRVLSKMFGVSQRCVAQVVTRKAWVDV